MPEIFTDKGFKSLHDKPKSFVRATIQKLFLKILSKLFPEKFLFYKDKIKFFMNKSGYYLYLFSISFCLRIKYPMYLRLPSTQIYALHILIKFLKTLEMKKINFDDSMIYSEFTKKMEDRKIPIKQMLREEALKAFEIWDKKKDKIEY